MTLYSLKRAIKMNKRVKKAGVNCRELSLFALDKTSLMGYL